MPSIDELIAFARERSLRGPAKTRSAESEAIRLGSGEVRPQLAMIADLVERGELDPDSPWPLALVAEQVKRLARPLGIQAPVSGVEDLRTHDDRRRFGLALVNDPTLAPILVPSAVGWLREAGALDPSGAVALLAEALEQEARRGRIADELDVLVRLGYMDGNAARRKRLKHAFDGSSKPLSRRQRQGRARLLARRGATTWPRGRGRRPGAEGRAAGTRWRDLLACYVELPPAERNRLVALRSRAARTFVRAHAERHGVSLATGKRDWLTVQRELAGRGQLAVLSARLDSAQREKFQRRLFS